MTYATDEILQTLKRARERSGMSQRDLSARVGVPQSHLSRIESGATDLRLSSLVELARSLDYELVLVPRKLLPAVEAITRSTSPALSDEARQRSAVLNRAQAQITRFTRIHPENPEIERLAQTFRELSNFQLSYADLDAVRNAAAQLARLSSGSPDYSTIYRIAKQLRELRNRIAHAVPDAPRPAYGLDEDDDDA